MNLKKTVLSMAGVITMVLAGMAPLVSAADQTTTTQGTITINNTGEFSPYFCEALEFASVDASASSQEVTGVIGICFKDTISWRGGFTGTISSSDWSAGTNRTIPKSAMNIVSVSGVGQTRWSSAICEGTPVWGVNRPCIADIGAKTPTTHHNGGYNTFAPWTGPDFGTSNLSVTESLYEGRGTILSAQKLNVKLTIPADQPAGNYVSTLTYDVVYTDGQP